LCRLEDLDFAVTAAYVAGDRVCSNGERPATLMQSRGDTASTPSTRLDLSRIASLSSMIGFPGGRLRPPGGSDTHTVAEFKHNCVVVTATRVIIDTTGIVRGVYRAGGQRPYLFRTGGGAWPWSRRGSRWQDRAARWPRPGRTVTVYPWQGQDVRPVPRPVSAPARDGNSTANPAPADHAGARIQPDVPVNGPGPLRAGRARAIPLQHLAGAVSPVHQPLLYRGSSRSTLDTGQQRFLVIAVPVLFSPRPTWLQRDDGGQ